MSNKTETPLVTEGSKTKVADVQPEGPSRANLPKSLQELGGSGPNNINWLNSSYSGTDIKVIAHLYGDKDADAKRQLQFDIDVAQKVADGATALQPTLEYYNVFANPNADSKAIFSMYCFSGKQPNSDEDMRALQILTNRLYNVWLLAMLFNDNVQSTGDFLLAAMLLAAEQQALVASLQDQLTTLKKLSDVASATLTLGHLQTISIQAHREKFAVRALGKSYVQGYTRGPRTLGGSMIFTVFDEHPLQKLIRAMGNSKTYGETDYDIGLSTLIPDQLPPVDLTIVFANEYGSISRMGIYGVEFLNDGMTMSIEDLFTEQVMNFVARDIDVMTSVGLVKLSQGERGMYGKDGMPVKATDLYYSSLDDYKKYLDRLGLRRMFKGR